MADNQYVNRVDWNGGTLIDLTSDDVSRADVALGKVFHLPSGEQTTGTSAGGGGVYNIVSTIDENDKQHIHITDAGEESLSFVRGLEPDIYFIKADGTLWDGRQGYVGEYMYKGGLIVTFVDLRYFARGVEYLGTNGTAYFFKAVGDEISIYV